MIAKFSTPILGLAEEQAVSGSVNSVLQILRRLCFSEFNEFFTHLPSEEYPALSRLLPAMSSDAVQVSWTGGSGNSMLYATIDFVRIINIQFNEICRRPMHNIRILDYGCGYGRLIRAMYYFTNPENIYGVDPWDKSIDICQNDRLLGRILQSDYLPVELPIPDQFFDLIYAFSVFTHTSLKATKSALAVLRKHITPGGLLILTTRPIEYWNLMEKGNEPGFSIDDQITQHNDVGFSYFGSSWNMPADGESIFGHTSMTPEWIMQNFPEWNIRSYDKGMDQHQLIFILTPVEL